MKKLVLVVPVVLLVSATVFAQNDSASLTRDTLPFQQPDKKEKPREVYKLNPGADIPVTAIGTGWSLYALSKIYDKDPSDPETISRLNKSDVNGFDRWSIRPYNKKIDDASFIPFYASMPMPVAFLF